MTMAGRCEVGDVLGLVEGDFVEIGDDLAEVAWRVVERLLSSGGGELLTLVRGRDADDQLVGRCARSDPRLVTVARRRRDRWRAGALPAVGGLGVTRHLRLVPELPRRPRRRLSGRRPRAAGPAAERPPAQFWRTTGFTRLAVPLTGILGGKTAKAFESLRLRTVGDLMLHLPRRYVSGTELSDLRHLTEGEEVTVLAQVRSASVHPMRSGRGSGKFRLQATITDGRGDLNLTFFGAKHLVDYWQGQLRPGVRGIFAGKVGTFQNQPQLTHPDFVTVDESATSSAAPSATSTSARWPARRADRSLSGHPKLRTWTIASCVSLALDSLDGMEDPLPEWVRQEADLMSQPTAYRAVHRPDSEDEITAGGAECSSTKRSGCSSPWPDVAPWRRRTACAVPRPRVVGGLRDAFDARLPFTLTGGAARDQRPAVRRPGPARTRCSGCCRGRSAPARPWWRCGPC